VGEAPKLPTQVSPDGREIWDWAAKLSEHTQRLAKVQQLKAEIAKPLRCGDCYWWMKSRDCPRERNVNGRNRGPSMNDWPCGKMQETADSIERREKHKAELAALQHPHPDRTKANGERNDDE